MRQAPNGLSGFGGATDRLGLITFGPLNFRGLGDAKSMALCEDVAFVINPADFGAVSTFDIWRLFA